MKINGGRPGTAAPAEDTKKRMPCLRMTAGRFLLLSKIRKALKPADSAKNHFSLRFFKHYIHTDYKQQKKKKGEDK